MEYHSPSPSIRTRIKQEFQESYTQMRPVWPFFGLLTLAMFVIYGLTLYETPVLRQPINWLILTLLMLVHTGLHWLSPLAAKNRTRSTLYLLVQLVLVVGLILFTHSQILVMGLFMALIGETLGVIRPLRRSLVAIFLLMLVAFMIHGLVFGWTGIWPFMVTVLPLTLFVVIYVSLFTRQLEERRRAETLLEELEIAHQQLGEYAARIEELTLTNERQRMARELHDTLSQGLAGVILQLEAAGEHLDQGRTEKGSAIVKQAISRARSTLAEARQVIDDLRNTYPTGVSLQDFIHAEAEHFTSLTGLPCEVVIDAKISLSDQLALQIEKIISEGLTNIARHAHAGRSWVHLTSRADQLILEIGDDGLGFSTETPPFASGHYGLVGIRERVRLAGGSLTIDSAPNQGTRLQMTFPIPADRNKQP